MAEWIPDTKPWWWDVIASNAYTLKAFLTDPFTFIRRRVAYVVVGGVLAGAKVWLFALKSTFLPTWQATTAIGEGLKAFAVGWSAAVLAIGRMVNETVLSVSGASLWGATAGTVAVAIVVYIHFWLAYQAVAYAADYIPFAGGIINE